MNCCIGDFKHSLCDCDNGICKEFKSIGNEEDFSNAVMQRIRPQGEWIYGEHDVAICDGYRCDRCGFFVPWDYEHKFIDFINDYHFCPNCGAKMEG